MRYGRHPVPLQSLHPPCDDRALCRSVEEFPDEPTCSIDQGKTWPADWRPVSPRGRLGRHVGTHARPSIQKTSRNPPWKMPSSPPYGNDRQPRALEWKCCSAPDCACSTYFLYFWIVPNDRHACYLVSASANKNAFLPSLIGPCPPSSEVR